MFCFTREDLMDRERWWGRRRGRGRVQIWVWGGEAAPHSGADKGEGDTGGGSLRVWKKGFGSFWLKVLEPL